MTSKNKLPTPLTPANCDVRDVPMPRELLVRLAMENFDLTEREADAMIERYFAEGKQ